MNEVRRERERESENDQVLARSNMTCWQRHQRKRIRLISSNWLRMNVALEDMRDYENANNDFFPPRRFCLAVL